MRCGRDARGGLGRVGGGGGSSGAGARVGRRGKLQLNRLRCLWGGECAEGDARGLHDDFGYPGRQVAAQVGDGNLGEAGRAPVGGLQHGFPLDEARLRAGDDGAGGLGVGLGPRAPVLLGVGGVAGASEESDGRVAGRASLPADAAPLGEEFGVEDIGLEDAFRGQLRPETINLAGIGGGGEDVSPLAAHHGGDLLAGGLGQVSKEGGRIDGQQLAFVAGAGQEPPVGGEGKGIDQFGSGGPQFFGGAIGGDANDRAASGGEAREAGPASSRLSGSGGSGSGDDHTGGDALGGGDGRLRGSSGSGRAREGGCGSFSPDGRDVEVAGGVEQEIGDLLAIHFVEHKSLAVGGEPEDQAVGLGAGVELAVGREREGADVGLVALEEKFAGAVGGDAVDFAFVAGGQVESPVRVQHDVPQVLGAGFEEDAGFARRGDLVHAAVGGGGEIEGGVAGIERQRVHLQLF